MHARMIRSMIWTAGLAAALAWQCAAGQPPASTHAPAAGAANEMSPPYGPSITLAQAEKVIAAARAAAARLGSDVNVIAVADTHGELVAFIRMDAATLHSVTYAQEKARGAARLRRTTATPPPELAAALTAMPDFVSMPGGIPIVHDGRTIGAVGVSGGHDAEIAAAAARSLD
jgi:glc operon protein GlcG